MFKKVKNIITNSYLKKFLLYGISAITGILLLLFLSVYFGFWGEIPSKEEITEIKFSSATEVLSDDGKLIGKFYIDDRQPITYDKVPKHLINALIATEDVRFFEHEGIDYNSLIRVFFKSILLRNNSSGGGSTISQQLVKNIYPRKRLGKLGIIVHKMREGIIAKRIEKIYSKEDILLQYLNIVPFSDNTFGIESTAKKFFNKKTKDLSIIESATIVAMLKATHSYNPRLYPKKSRTRRNVVLSQMNKYGYLDDEQLAIEKEKPLTLSYKDYSPDKGIAPYFRAQVQKKLQEWCNKNKDENGENYNPYTSGLKVHTTLNYDMQLLAEDAIKEHMAVLQKTFENEHGKNAPWLNKDLIASELEKTNTFNSLKKKGYSKKEIYDSLKVHRNLKLFDWRGYKLVKGTVIDSIKNHLKFLNVGMIALEPTNGGVKSWVGGIDFEFFKYDHVSQSKRQVGSTFKPIVYAAALENGMHPCEYIPAKVITYKNLENWAPKNSSNVDPDKRYSMKTALSRSINTCAVKVLEETGIKRTTKMAQKMGIRSNIPQVPSMALGTAELSLLELAKVYSCFVNNSKPSDPFLITKITDKTGNVLEDFTLKKSIQKVFSETTRQTMIEYMKETVNGGTAIRLRSKYKLKNDIAGKTGTTQNNKDGWFMGITPKLIVGTWVGVDNHNIGFKSTKYGQGAHSALPIFALLMQKMNKQEKFNSITNAKFTKTSPAVLERLECRDYIDENFLRRLFAKRKQQRFNTPSKRKRRRKRKH